MKKLLKVLIMVMALGGAGYLMYPKVMDFYNEYVWSIVIDHPQGVITLTNKKCENKNVLTYAQFYAQMGAPSFADSKAGTIKQEEKISALCWVPHPDGGNKYFLIDESGSAGFVEKK